MPNYQTTPFKPMPQLLVAGSPAFVWGSFNDKTGPTTGIITFSKTNGTTTATVKIQILSGNIPVNGSLISVVGSANGANFNVVNAAIANVTMIPDANGNDTGLYSLTYTISATATPLAYTADAASFVIPQPEVGEAVTGTGASVPVAVAAAGANANGRSLSVTLTLGTGLSGVTAVLQGANRDIDGEYSTVGTIGTNLGVSTTDWQSGQGNTGTGTLAAGSVTFPNFRFYRINLTSVTGSGLVVAKIMQ